jgi:dTDP-4-dehydrorhamnose 3,5-epimerase
MKFIPQRMAEVVLIEPKVFGDERGWFLESHNRRVFAEGLGHDVEFVQDNHSRSLRGVLRGLHYQVRQPQGKLVRAVHGAIFDVAVDLRRGSPSFGQWLGVELTAENRRMLWIPPGFGHGFLTLSDAAEVQYKASDYYAPQHERSVLWNDPRIGIAWPLQGQPVLSAKDAAGLPLDQAEIYP